MKPRRRRIKFFGGIYDGQVREVSVDKYGRPPFELVVYVGSHPMATATADTGLPDRYHVNTDTYRLELWTDGTLIPEKVYRLRAMTR